MPARSLRIEYLLGLLTALGPLTIDMYLPSLPTIAADFGVLVSDVELTLASYFAGFALGQLVVGPALDTWGRVRPLRLGLVLYLLGSIGCLVAPSLSMLIAARFIQALGGAVVVVVPRAIVRDMYEGPDIARAMTRLILVMGIAPIVAPTLGGAILPLGWRTIFGVLAVVSVAMFALTWFLPETHVRGPKRSLWKEARVLVTELDFVCFTLIGGFAMGAMFAYISSSSNIIIEIHGIDPAYFGLFFGANAAAFILMSQLSRWFLKYFTPAALLRGAMVGLIAGAVLIYVATVVDVGGLPLLMLGLSIYLGALGVLAPNATALALSPHGQRAGLASAIMGATQSALAATFALTVSTTSDGTAAPVGIIMTAGIALSAIVMFTHGVLRRR